MEDLFNLFEKPKNPLSFNAIKVSIASPEKIRSWSHGEVRNPKPLIIELSSRNGMVFSVPKFLAQQRLRVQLR